MSVELMRRYQMERSLHCHLKIIGHVMVAACLLAVADIALGTAVSSLYSCGRVFRPIPSHRPGFLAATVAYIALAAGTVSLPHPRW